MTAFDNISVGFIGGGIMAEAVIKGLLRQQLVPAERIIASDPLEARRAHLAGTLHIRTTASNAEAVNAGQLLVLAVKPQVLRSVMAELGGSIPTDRLVLSIVAGAKLAAIRKHLGAQAIVRVMPNTPAQVGEGVSVWTATPEVNAIQREQARAILAALGPEVYMEGEGYLDMAAAISGSGPAYVFLIIEALIDAGVRMGCARPVAEKLVLQTVRGSAIYAQQSGQHPAVLRNMVTSPGGTTAAALHVLEKGGLRALLSDAAQACYERSQYLGSLGEE
ncbi:MAG: pyrroline-5-carboxylate reductase [Chloroflexi bacterium]|nr:pyrroline-5-carboxylate reductase [Chloroflexota bacterium]